ncbi:hypothetical protein [Solibacillus daqui]|uniref:hypothetical protein n=1 Tax=Solibacillus daqui TaxID=2912187 RepID=UPI0023657505|nr:hypothetical protein [Solibacillus daqui]
MSYIKLVNFEVQRFFKFFIALVVVVATTQVIAAFLSASNYKDQAETVMQREKLLALDYVTNYGSYSIFNFFNNSLFLLSIMFAAAMLMIYIFFIWYRDWLGKSSFIYRLLMLPTERRNVYFAKLTAILLFVFCIVGVQVLLVQVAELIMKWVIPAELLIESGVIIAYSYELMSILYPKTMVHFLVSYGVGTAFVAMIFTAILVERSYHLKGIFIAGVYITLSLALLLVPVFIGYYTDYFYVKELLMMVVFMALIVFVSSVIIANYLLKRKINV